MDEDELQSWTPAFPGQRPPFQKGNQWRFEKGNLANLEHGAHSERMIAAKLPEAWEMVRNAIQSERGRLTPSDELFGQRMARTLAVLWLYDEHEDKLLAEYAARLEEGDDPSTLGELLDQLGKFADKKGRAEHLLLKMGWHIGAGRMPAARIVEALSAARQPGEQWREAQKAVLRKIEGSGPE